MSVRVRIPTPLRSATDGEAELSSEAATVVTLIEELEAMRECGARSKTGVVIGGGLLGLECAKALRDMDLQTHVVEFAPRLITRVLERLTDDPDLGRRSLAEARYPKELEAPHDGAEEAVRTLSRRYRIGVIANQSAGTEERLTNWGLMPFVSICLSSAELGLAKPDPAIFRLALSRATCAPAEAVMIGDRLDNDIRPARLQGWWAVRILQGFHQFQSPRDELDKADATVKGLSELLPLFVPAIA